MLSREVPGVDERREPIAGMVSIIVTCFNGERWIRRAVDSALAQSYLHREILIVDDASTDSSVQCLESYRALADLKLVVHRHNRGIPATKNHGVRHARGEYVAFLEQDDEWLPDKLSRQAEVFTADARVGLVYTDAVYVEADGRELLLRGTASVPLSSREAAVKAVFLNNPVTSMSSVAMRRGCLEELGGFDESFHGADDYDLWLRVAGHSRMVHIEEPLVRYQCHPGSFSSANTDRMLEDRLRIVRQAAASTPALQALEKGRLASVWLSSAVHAFERRASRQALGYVLHALRLAPGLRKIYWVLALLAMGSLGRALLGRWRLGTQFQERHPAPTLAGSEP